MNKLEQMCADYINGLPQGVNIPVADMFGAGFLAAVQMLESERAETALPAKPMQFEFERSWASGNDWAKWLREQVK